MSLPQVQWHLLADLDSTEGGNFSLSTIDCFAIEKLEICDN